MVGETEKRCMDLTSLQFKVDAPTRQEPHEDAQYECWICREAGTLDKPLMSFCKCKGTMRGVHTECVENWIQLQRTSGDTEHPRCSVCHHTYEGRDAYPSVFFLGGTLCGRFCSLILRASILAFVMLVYWNGTVTEPPVGIVMISMALLYLVTKSYTLANSLPLYRIPPVNRWQRYFYSTEPDEMGQMCSELWSCVIGSCVGVLQGQLKWYWVLPLIALAVLPALRIVFPNPSMRCIQTAMAVLVAVILSPVFLVVALARKVLTSPRKVFHFGRPMLHSYVAFACLIIAANGGDDSSFVVLLVIWSVHLGLMAIGGAITILAPFCSEDFVLLEWKQSRTWVITWELTLLCTYWANVCCEPPEYLATWYALVSSLWFLSVSVLVVTVNRRLLLDSYDRWRRRHAVFSLRGALVEV